MRLWKRSLKIYGYHLLMLALAFTVVAGFAVHTHKVALTNLWISTWRIRSVAIVARFCCSTVRRSSTSFPCT